MCGGIEFREWGLFLLSLYIWEKEDSFKMKHGKDASGRERIAIKSTSRGKRNSCRERKCLGREGKSRGSIELQGAG